MSRENAISFCQRLTEYANTLSTPAAKVKLLNEVRDLQSKKDCAEMQAEQAQITTEAKKVKHGIACAIGALQSMMAKTEGLAEKSQTQEGRIARHSEGQQHMSDVITGHAEQAASSSDEHLKKALEERLDEERQSMADGIVKLAYQAEKEQKRKHAKEIAELQNEHVKRLKIISIGKHAENSEKWFEEDNSERWFQEDNSEKVVEEDNLEEEMGELVENTLMAEGDQKERHLEAVWLTTLEADDEKDEKTLRRIEILKAKAKEQETTYWLARHRGCYIEG